jgi:hypothetical protein
MRALTDIGPDDHRPMEASPQGINTVPEWGRPAMCIQLPTPHTSAVAPAAFSAVVRARHVPGMSDRCQAA